MWKHSWSTEAEIYYPHDPSFLSSFSVEKERKKGGHRLRELGLKRSVMDRAPGRYLRLDLFIKVLSLLCPNLTDASRGWKVAGRVLVPTVTPSSLSFSSFPLSKERKERKREDETVDEPQSFFLHFFFKGRKREKEGGSSCVHPPIPRALTYSTKKGNCAVVNDRRNRKGRRNCLDLACIRGSWRFFLPFLFQEWLERMWLSVDSLTRALLKKKEKKYRR